MSDERREMARVIIFELEGSKFKNMMMTALQLELHIVELRLGEGEGERVA
jgi:hypothetical protein